MEQLPEEVLPPERDGDGAAFVMTDPTVLAGSDAPPPAAPPPAAPAFVGTVAPDDDEVDET
jgi:hypothetical protein